MTNTNQELILPSDDSAPILAEKILFLFLDSTTSEVLVSKSDKYNLFGTDFVNNGQNKLSLKLCINRYLSLLQIPINHLQLICVNDSIHLNTIYRIYLSTVKLDSTQIPDSLEYVKVKNLTNKSKPNSKLYLDTFLKIFADIELTRVLTKLR